MSLNIANCPLVNKKASRLRTTLVDGEEEKLRDNLKINVIMLARNNDNSSILEILKVESIYFEGCQQNRCVV